MLCIKSKNIDYVIERFLSYCHIYKYVPQRTFIYQGKIATTLYYLIHGTAVVFIKDNDGKEIILSYLNKGEFIGELGFFTPEKNRSAEVRTKNTCILAEISYKKLNQLIQINSEIITQISQQMANRLQITSEKVCNLAFLDVTGRIVQTLLNLSKQPEAITHPNGMQINITRQEISRIVGCSRETVGKIIKKLEKQNIVSAHGKTIVIYGTR